MEKHLIILSGNIAVGKTSLGPKLADRLNAKWISESEISMLFPNLISDQFAESKLISEITFSSLRTAMILSKFQMDTSIIVMERGLLDDLIFFNVWKEKYNLQQYEGFIADLHAILNNHPLYFTTHTIYLKNTRKDVLVKRINKRNLIYDHVFTEEFLLRLEEAYDHFLQLDSQGHVYPIDVSEFDIHDTIQVGTLIESVIKNLKISLNEYQ